MIEEQGNKKEAPGGGAAFLAHGGDGHKGEEEKRKDDQPDMGEHRVNQPVGGGDGAGEKQQQKPGKANEVVAEVDQVEIPVADAGEQQPECLTQEFEIGCDPADALPFEVVAVVHFLIIHNGFAGIADAVDVAGDFGLHVFVKAAGAAFGVVDDLLIYFFFNRYPTAPDVDRKAQHGPRFAFDEVAHKDSEAVELGVYPVACSWIAGCLARPHNLYYTTC